MSLSEHNQACRRQRAGSVLLLAAAALCVLLNQCESLSRKGKEKFFSLHQWNKIFTINILPHLIIQSTINHESVSNAQSYPGHVYKPLRVSGFRVWLFGLFVLHFKSIKLCFFRDQMVSVIGEEEGFLPLFFYFFFALHRTRVDFPSVV